MDSYRYQQCLMIPASFEDLGLENFNKIQWLFEIPGFELPTRNMESHNHTYILWQHRSLIRIVNQPGDDRLSRLVAVFESCVGRLRGSNLVGKTDACHWIDIFGQVMEDVGERAEYEDVNVLDLMSLVLLYSLSYVQGESLRNEDRSEWYQKEDMLVILWDYIQEWVDLFDSRRLTWASLQMETCCD
ncbi:hypothetical protein ACHAQH_005961 [Verticillium albo-atrum]